MTEIVDKVLSSGLVNRATIKLMEQWKYLPEGSSDKVKEDALVGATQEVLTKLADDLANEVEKVHRIKETSLDLDRIKWPATIESIWTGTRIVAKDVLCVVDRMGRYYFRIQDVDESWFIPGYNFHRRQTAGEAAQGKLKSEVILESQVLYVGDQKACIQVSTEK